MSLSAQRISAIQIWTEFACLMGTRVCEREIRAPLFSWNFILMLRVEFLRNMMTSFSISETDLLSICLSESLCGFVNILARPNHGQL